MIAMNGVTTQFRACPLMPWTGRYARVMGDAPRCFTFPIPAAVSGPCWIGRPTPGLQHVARRSAPPPMSLSLRSRKPRGILVAVAPRSFLINEFGKVLVPASDGAGQRLLAGRLSGTLLFENPFLPEEPIDLSR